MLARELQFLGAWQPCKQRCPSWERGFLFPGHGAGMAPGNSLPSLRGRGALWSSLEMCVRHGAITAVGSEQSPGRGSQLGLENQSSLEMKQISTWL